MTNGGNGMTITAERLEAGIADWMDRELVPKVGGLRKVALVMGATLAIPQRVRALLPCLVELGVATEDGMVDIDLLYKTAKEAFAKTGPVKQNLLGMDVTLGAEDVETLYTIIRGTYPAGAGGKAV